MQQYKKQILESLYYAIGVALYTALVSTLMANGQRIFGSMSGILAGALMLTLICLSAATVGSLIFGRPVFLVITGEKKTGVMQLIFTLSWLLIFLIIGFSVVLLFFRSSGSIY